MTIAVIQAEHLTDDRLADLIRQAIALLKRRRRTAFARATLEDELAEMMIETGEIGLVDYGPAAGGEVVA